MLPPPEPPSVKKGGERPFLFKKGGYTVLYTHNPVLISPVSGFRVIAAQTVSMSTSIQIM